MNYDIQLLLFVVWLIVASAIGYNWSVAESDPASYIFMLILTLASFILFFKLLFLMIDFLKMTILMMKNRNGL